MNNTKRSPATPAVVDPTTLEQGGWRAGRPLEDPEKTKRWGFVSAKPSEFLVHVRRGEVRVRSSGQGMTCFKWPWDAVAIIPTSLQRLQFTADQVTIEKVGVSVTGLAVYRIADPLLAYRVLNFAYPERAQQKLEETLTAMFVGATRRFVANLTVDECLQKRKSAIAEELLREIAPVVGGSGRPDDRTSQGWGVVLDTIEIQEVRVSSATVFAAMQAPYRAALERRAREARADADKAVATREALCNQEIEETRLATQAALAVKQATVAREAERLRADTEVDRQRLAAVAAQAQIAAFAEQAEAAERRAQLERVVWSATLEQRRAHAEVELFEGQSGAEARLAAARAGREEAEAQARVLMAQNLPHLAAAVGQRIGEVKIVQLGGVENAFAGITQAVTAVLDLARKG